MKLLIWNSFSIVFGLAIFFFFSLASCIADKLPEEFYIGDGGPFSSYSVSLNNNVYTYKLNKNGKLKSRTLKPPTDQEWREFWNNIDKISLWIWASNYTNKSPLFEVSDGPRWEVLIKRDSSHAVSAKGENAYPSDTDPKKADLEFGKTQRFRSLEEAVEKLFGIDELGH